MKQLGPNESDRSRPDEWQLRLNTGPHETSRTDLWLHRVADCNVTNLNLHEDTLHVTLANLPDSALMALSRLLSDWVAAHSARAN